MALNDLANTWRELAGEPQYPSPKTYRAGFDNGQYSARSVCAFDLESLSRTAWYPISCRDDAKGCPVDMVMVRKIDGTIHQVWGPNLQSDWDVYTHWARIEDVVLLPQSNEK